jgi:hypothetical protein
MPAPLPVDRKLVEALYMSGLRPCEIGKRMGLRPATIAGWAHRFGWYLALQKATPLVEYGPGNGHSRASISLRHQFSDELAKTATALGKVPYKSNLRELKKRADVLEPLARTAKIVHDWGNETKPGLIIDMKQVEVTALPEPETALPEPETIKEIPFSEPDAEPEGTKAP